MTFLHNILTIFTFLYFCILITAQDCSKGPVPHSCNYYLCVEKALPCGPTGYSLGYGYYYCNKFEQNAGEFSPKGQQWMFNVMQCLQSKLIPYVDGSISPTERSCASLKSYAFHTHPACYTAPGSSICDLPPTEWIVLVSIIGIKEVLAVQTIVQEVDVAGSCTEEYLKDVENILKKIYTSKIEL